MSIEEVLEGIVRRVLREELARLPSTGVDDVLTYAEAAADVKVDKSLIGRWVQRGLLPAHGRGKAKRVYRSDVRKALEQSGAGKNATKTAAAIAEGILSKPGRRPR